MLKIINFIIIGWLMLSAIGAGATALSTDSTLVAEQQIASILVDIGLALIIMLSNLVGILTEFFDKFKFRYDEKLDGVADSTGGTEV